MKKIALLMTVFLFVACESQEDFETLVAAEVMPEIERGMEEKGLEDSTCRLIERELIPIKEEDGNTLYRGNIECSSPEYRPVRAKLFVASDGHDYTWDVQ